MVERGDRRVASDAAAPQDASPGPRPLARRLVELLESSASGRLEVGLHPEPRNFVAFREGLPVQVALPDLGPTLVSVLIEEGAVSEAEGLELVRLADSVAATESRVIARRKLLGAGPLREARRRRAEQQLARLFTRPEVELRFRAGEPEVDPAEITLLEPLSVLFRGLRQCPERVASACAPAPEVGWRLAASYPAGVDPFGFGPELEGRLIEGDLSVEALARDGVPPADARAAMACLHLTRMLAPTSAPRREPSPPTAVGHPTLPASTAAERETETELAAQLELDTSLGLEPPAVDGGAAEGLVVHKRSGGMVPLARAPEAPPPPEAPSARASAGRGGAIERRLGPWEDKTYFQILRVGPETDEAQLERAYRFLARRAAGEEGEPGGEALAGLLREAWVYLRDPQRRARYAGAPDRERRALEAEPKVERAVRALGEGRGEEARYLAGWAARLAPHRSELASLQSALDWLGAPLEGRGPGPRAALVAEARRTQDRRIKLVLAAVCAAEGDRRAARALAQEVGAERHPLAERLLAEGAP